MTTRKIKRVQRSSLAVSGVDNGAGNAVTVMVPSWKNVNSIQVSCGGIVVTATGDPVAAVAGDDITILGSVDGVFFFDLGTSGAAVVIGLDDNGFLDIPANVSHLYFEAAQIQSTETWKLNLIMQGD